MAKHEWIIRILEEIGEYAELNGLNGIAKAAPLLTELAKAEIDALETTSEQSRGAAAASSRKPLP